jgi:Ca2+-binding EF-hand superfamily protein
VNQTDKNRNGFIDKDEFEQLLLPKFKEEMLMYENNIEDIRRLFKEFDTDYSGYLNK